MTAAARRAPRPRTGTDPEARRTPSLTALGSNVVDQHRELADVVRASPGSVEALLAALSREPDAERWAEGALSVIADELACLHDALGVEQDRDAQTCVHALEQRVRAIATVAEAVRLGRGVAS